MSAQADKNPNLGPATAPVKPIHRAGAVEAASEHDEGVGNEGHGHGGNDQCQGGSAAGDAGEDGGCDHHACRGRLNTYGLGDCPEEAEPSSAKPFSFARAGVGRYDGAPFAERGWWARQTGLPLIRDLGHAGA